MGCRGLIEICARIAAAAALVFVASCTPDHKNDEPAVGTWTIVPAPPTPSQNGERPTQGAWRLNIRTGEIQFCEYNGTTLGDCAVQR